LKPADLTFTLCEKGQIPAFGTVSLQKGNLGEMISWAHLPNLRWSNYSGRRALWRNF